MTQNRASVLYDTLIIPTLTLLCMWVAFNVIPIALQFMDTDTAWMALESDRFRALDFPAFYNGVWYGGNAFGLVRSAVTILIENITPASIIAYFPNLDAYTFAHYSFSFWFTPLLMSLSVYFMTLQYFDRKTSTLMAVVTAFGFQHFFFRYGYDWHILNFILTCIFLGIKARHSNPFLSLPTQMLFCFTFLTGLGIYNGRTFLLTAFVFWLPMNWAFEQFSHLRRATLESGRNLEKTLALLFWVLIFLFFYLEIFSGNLGLTHKMVKLQASPNFDLASIILTILIFKWNWNQVKNITQTNKMRVLFFVLGFVLGILPELLTRLQSNSGSTSWPNTNFEVFFQLFGTFPAKFVELITGSLNLSRQFSILWVTLSVLFLLLHSLRSQSIRSTFAPILLFCVLCIYAFCRVQTFSPGSVRYLFALFPALILILGFPIFRLYSQKQWKLLTAFLLLVTGHLFHHYTARGAWSMELEKSGAANRIRSINKIYQDAGIDIVFSNDYYHSAVYSFASSKRIAYLEPGGLYPKFAEIRFHEALKNQKAIGILIHKKEAPEITANSSSISLKDHVYKMRFLAEISDFYLFSSVP